MRPQVGNQLTFTSDYVLQDDAARFPVLYYCVGDKEGVAIITLSHSEVITTLVLQTVYIRSQHTDSCFISVREEWSGVQDMLRVVVRGPENALGLECPDLVATGEPFACTFTLHRTSGLSLTVANQETQEEQSYTLPG